MADVRLFVSGYVTVAEAEFDAAGESALQAAQNLLGFDVEDAEVVDDA